MKDRQMKKRLFSLLILCSLFVNSMAFRSAQAKDTSEEVKYAGMGTVCVAIIGTAVGGILVDGVSAYLYQRLGFEKREMERWEKGQAQKCKGNQKLSFAVPSGGITEDQISDKTLMSDSGTSPALADSAAREVI